jgi:hypothetical protein
MAEDTKAEVKASEISQAELCDRCVQLVFGGDQRVSRSSVRYCARNCPPAPGQSFEQCRDRRALGRRRAL